MSNENDTQQIIQRLERAEQMIVQTLDAHEAGGTISEPTLAHDDHQTPVLARIGTLEQQVVKRIARIGQEVAEVSPIQPESAAAAPVTEPIATAEPAETPQWVKNLTDIEWLTSRLGIGLLVIGVITLLFWLNDQPWVTNGMRLGAGYGIGAILLGMGLSFRNSRPSFGQVLSGGGIAIWYLSTYVGFEVFELIPDLATLPITFVITAVAYGLAAWQKRQPLAYIGLLLGLIMPPFLAPDDPSLPIFIGYVCILLAGAVTIAALLKWRWLNFAAFSIGWLYMAIFTFVAVDNWIDDILVGDQWAMQLGIVVTLALFGIFPLVRQLRLRSGLTAADLAIQTDADGKETNPYPVDWIDFFTIVTSPLLGVLLMLALWPDMGTAAWMIITVLTAAIYMVVGLALGRDARFEIFQVPLFLVGAILLPMSLLKVEGDITVPLLITLSVEAAGLALFGIRRNLRWLLIATHLLFVWSFFLWLAGILPETIDRPFANLNFLASVIFVIGLGVTAWVQPQGLSKSIYQAFAHLIALPVTGFELDAQFDGKTYWLILHTLIHAGVFALGYLRDNKWLRYQAIVFAGLAMLVQAGFDVEGDLTWPNMMVLLSAGIILAVNVIKKQLNDRLEDGDKDQLLQVLGLLLAAAGGFVMVVRLGATFEAGDVTPFVNTASLVSVLMMVALLLVDLRFAEKPYDSLIGVGTHILALIWLAFQVQDFEYSLGLISALWAVYAIALLIAGMVFDRSLMRQLGIGTILLTIAKLILVDLENVSTGVRVILFSGFGGVLLAISYFARNIWRKPEEPSEPAVLAD